MSDVVVNLVLTALLSAQAPLPTPPDLLIPPIPAQPPVLDLRDLGSVQQKDPVGPKLQDSKDIVQPAPLVVPTIVQTNPSKPTPFRLLDGTATTMENTYLKPAPMPFADAAIVGLATPCLLLTRSGPSSIRAGQTFSYEITVRNTGTATAVQARLEDELPQGTKVLRVQPSPVTVGERVAWIIDNLAPAGEQRFQVEVEAGRNGEWKANATLTVSVSSAVNANVTGGVRQPLLVAGPTSALVGHPVKFQIRVSNPTEGSLTEVVLRVQLPPGLQHLHGDSIETPVGDMSPGQSREMTLEVIALQTGRLNAEVTLVSSRKAVAGAQISLAAMEQPILSIRLTGPLSPPLGGEHDYRLEIVNRGTTEVRDVQIWNILPDGLQLAGADGGGQYEAATRTIRWNVGTLASGEGRQVVFRAQIRGIGPQINRVGARAAGVADAHLHTVVRVGNR